MQPETYAIAKADLLLKGEGAEAANIKYGSTLSQDGHPGLEFDFMLANPPYGKSWAKDLDQMGGKKEFADRRFVFPYAGDPKYSLLTRSSVSGQQAGQDENQNGAGHPRAQRLGTVYG